MRCSKSRSQKEVYSNTILSQERRNTSNRQPYFTSKTNKNKEQKKKKKKNTGKNPKIRRKEIIKIRAEINEKEIKDTIVKINKAKSWFFEKINKIDKILARSSRKKKNQINKIRNEKRRGYNR